VRIVATIENETKGADYLAALESAGFDPSEIQPLYSKDPAPSEFDGLLLCGGEDMDPALYGAPPHEMLKSVNRRRDDQELALIAAARRKDVPILGICRGMQVLNVAYGGTLVQDIPSERPSAVEHSVKQPKDFRAHEVIVSSGCFLGAEGRKLSVNSRHHQGVDRLGRGLRVCARAGDGLIEAFEAAGNTAPVFAVQWHPENMRDDPDAVSLFRRFRDAVLRRGRVAIR
jgi:putative glutamine amidotransferase